MPTSSRSSRRLDAIYSRREDVRTDVLRYRTQMLLWSGIIREVRPVETVQGPGMEVLFKHHYWDFIEDYSVQKARAFLSPRGEGMFQAAFRKQHAPPPEHVRVDDMAIVYGTPERLDADGWTVVLTGVRLKTFPKGLYATDIWDYGRDFLLKGDRNDFRVLAGIAGEPIPLDSPKLDPKSKDYLARVRQMIKGKWAYPCVEEKSWLLGERCDYKAVELVIDFGILRDGRVPYVIVRRPSEFAIYNEFAVNAVKLAAPFPPIPESMLGERQGLPIRAAFKYVVDWRRP
jgi:hypothetical protein